MKCHIDYMRQCSNRNHIYIYINATVQSSVKIDKDELWMIPWESRAVCRGPVHFVLVFCPEGRSQSAKCRCWVDCWGWHSWEPLKASPKGGDKILLGAPLSGWHSSFYSPKIGTTPKVSLMILSSQKLPELWDYFLIYVSGALEFNPESQDVDLGLFPLRMNPTIKTR